MAKTVLEITDEVNIKFHNLDASTRRKMNDACKYFLPNARYTPAFKLGRWNGYIYFCDIAARSYVQMLDKLLPIVQNEGYEVDVLDKRTPVSFEFDEVQEDSYSFVKWPKNHPAAGQPIMLREHQVEVTNIFLKNTQSVQCVPTGAGKTLITAMLSHKVEKYGRSIIIVPNKDLVTQTEKDYKNLGLDVGVFYGDRKEYNKTHTVCTWQSLDILHKKTKKKEAEFPLQEFLEDVACIIIDECHKAKSDVLKKLLTGPFANIPMRWGLTGTIPPEEYDAVSLYCSVGPLINTLKTKTLQDSGVLSQLHINILQTDDGNGLFANYQDEFYWLVNNKNRLNMIAQHIISQSQTGNTLVLIDRINTGEELSKLIPNSVFISGEVKSADRREEYDSISQSNNKVIIATSGVASTGIDIPRIFNLYLIESGKSFVRVIQSIGRGIRKAEDKDFINVFDVCSTTKYSKRHLTKRKKFYTEANYPYSIQKVIY